MIDNCPVHYEVQGLSNVRLEFLPPNTTSKSQPMDQGVIRSLKCFYRRKIVREFIRSLDAGNVIPKVNILSAMTMLASAWGEVSQDVIMNCFRKCGFSVEAQELAIADDDDPFKMLALQADVEELRQLDSDLLPEEFTVEEIVSFDDETLVAQEQSTDADIISWAKGEDEDEDNDDEEDTISDAEVPCPTTRQLYSAIDTIRRYSHFATTDVEKLRNTSDALEKVIDCHRANKREQKNITEFFTKQ